jgi:hypothetical protein
MRAVQRTVFAGDLVRLADDALDGGAHGVVEEVVSWRDAVLGMRGPEAQELTRRVDAEMVGRGGRGTWARVRVRLDTGRVVTVDAPWFVVERSRAEPVRVGVAVTVDVEEVGDVCGTDDRADAARKAAQ